MFTKQSKGNISLLPYTNICMIFFVLLIVLDLDFFGLIPTEIYSSFNKGMDRTGEIVLLGILMFFQYHQKSKLSCPQLLYWKRYFIFMFYIIIICGFSSMIRYEESFMDIYVMTNIFLLLFLAFPLMDDLDNQNRYIRLFWIVNLINLCLVVLQSVIYNATGTLFLQTLSSDGISMRNDLIRFGNLYYSPILIICAYGGCMFIKEYVPKWIFYSVIPLGIYGVLFIGMTRGMIYPLIVALGAMFLVKQGRFDIKAFAVITLIIAIPFIIQMNQVQFLLNSVFSTDSAFAAESHNVSIRFQNIAYRMGFFNQNPVFAMGIVRAVGYHLRMISQGPSGLYYALDVGNIDILASFGIFGFVLWGAIWVRWFNILKKLIMLHILNKNSWVLGLIIYYCLSSFTLGYFAPERIVPFAIALCLIEKSAESMRQTINEK